MQKVDATEPKREYGEQSSVMRPNVTSVRRQIDVGARLSTPYLTMNALATVVAAYGLLSNSTAVVIGAMIIAMLLGPIMGLALALVDGDVGLLKRSLIAEIVGAALVLAIGFMVGKLHGNLPVTPEILSRTKPTLIDLGIAVAGGAAGAYATVSPRVSVGLVGVAISTALVPPLTACGICFARGLPEQAMGALLLFVTNLVAIQCASSIVLFAFGYHEVTRRQSNDKNFLRRLIIDGILFLALTVFLSFQLSSVVQQQQFEQSVRTQLNKSLTPIAGAFLAEVRFVPDESKDIIVAVVRSPYSITPEQVAQFESALPVRKGRQIELHVRSLITKESTTEGYLHQIDPTAPPIDQVQVPPTDLPKSDEDRSLLGTSGTNQTHQIDSPAAN